MTEERDNGWDKTDPKEERRLVKEQLRVQNIMPFYESEPDVPYAPRLEREKDKD